MSAKKTETAANYPLYSDEQIWEMCLTILSHDEPIAGMSKELGAFQSDFLGVIAKMKKEHQAVKYKYYRTDAGEGVINPLYLDHYSKLLYCFSRALYKKGNVSPELLDLLFFSLKSRCGVDFFYGVELGDYFLPLHAHGTILGNATYGKYLAVVQNCTVGNNKGVYPTIGDAVILRPGAMVLGNCKIGNNVHIGAGAMIIDKDIPDNSVVFGHVPNLVIKLNPGNNLDIFFDTARL